MSFYLPNIRNIFEVTKVTIKIFTIFFTIIKLKQLRVLRSPETEHILRGTNLSYPEHAPTSVASL